MTHYRKAIVTITATVFVPVEEMADALGLKHDEFTPEEKLLGMDMADTAPTFEILAREKIDALCPTDDPLRIRDVSVDMTTYA